MFLPFLKDKILASFPDPTTVSGTAREAQWTYECKVAAIWKKIGLEILGWVDAKVDEAKQLEKKRKGEVIDTFGIGRE